MRRVIAPVLAVAVGVLAGWTVAGLVDGRAGGGPDNGAAIGLLTGARGALETAARTLEQLERPPGTWDTGGGWRAPILERSRASWSDLFPWYDPALPVDPPTLQGCLRGPGVAVSGCRDLTADVDGITFPGPGSWIFDTSYGGVKVLILETSGDRRRRAIDIATFVASNVVHSAAESRRFTPWRIEEIPALHVPRLFWSTQPVKDRCGGVAALAACVLEDQGFPTRKVEIGTAQDGHIVAEVDIGGGEWMVVDADWGYVFTDGEGVVLDVETIRRRLMTGEAVVVRDIGGGKKWLRPELNLDDGPPFHWSRACEDRARDPAWLLAWLGRNLGAVRTSSFDTRLASERTLDRSESLTRAIAILSDDRPTP